MAPDRRACDCACHEGATSLAPARCEAACAVCGAESQLVPAEREGELPRLSRPRHRKLSDYYQGFSWLIVVLLTAIAVSSGVSPIFAVPLSLSAALAIVPHGVRRSRARELSI